MVIPVYHTIFCIQALETDGLLASLTLVADHHHRDCPVTQSWLIADSNQDEDDDKLMCVDGTTTAHRVIGCKAQCENCCLLETSCYVDL